MGKVYKVRNTISDRVEAMKILLPDLAGQKDLADRFLREIKVLASLHHPNIAALRTALTLDNQLVMIMEFVDGVTLSSRLHQGAIPPALAVKYIDQVLDALSYAHKQNIIHRDIKPANMMLTPDGTVKLMDFGIARSASDRSLTMTGTTLGSLNYMPPEQVKGDPADNRSDLYSLGVSLYEMVTGQLPFTADSNYAMMAAHLQEVPKPPIVLRPGIPQALNQIIVMALAKDPGQRFQSADAFRGALKSVPAQGAATQAGADPRAFVPSASAGSATALFQETPASQSPTTVMDTPAFPQTPRVAASPAAAAASADAMPQAPPPPVSGNSHRGLYIALGAFIVVVVLFAAGLYLPSRIKTLAGAGKSVPPAASFLVGYQSVAYDSASLRGRHDSVRLAHSRLRRPTSTEAATAPPAHKPCNPANRRLTLPTRLLPHPPTQCLRLRHRPIPAALPPSPQRSRAPRNPKKNKPRMTLTLRQKPTKPQPSKKMSTATTISTAAPQPSRNPWTIFSVSKQPRATAFAATSSLPNST